MRFSKWHAHGNVYLLTDERGLSPERVRAEVGDADGIVEIVSATEAEADVVIWNPDGSTAELSGNGTRIAARWLADRTGVAEVRIRVGSRETVARVKNGDVEQELGAVTVSGPEQIVGLDVIVGRRRQPARGRGRRSRRPAAHRAAARDARTLSEPHERPGGPRRRARRGDGTGLGARRGGDTIVRNERRRSRRGDPRRRRRARPLSRRRPPREPLRRPRHAHGACRAATRSATGARLHCIVRGRQVAEFLLLRRIRATRRLLARVSPARLSGASPMTRRPSVKYSRRPGSTSRAVSHSVDYRYELRPPADQFAVGVRLYGL